MNRGNAEKAKRAKAMQTKAKAAQVRKKLNQDRARARQGAADEGGFDPSTIADDTPPSLRQSYDA